MAEIEKKQHDGYYTLWKNGVCMGGGQDPKPPKIRKPPTPEGPTCYRCDTKLHEIYKEVYWCHDCERTSYEFDPHQPDCANPGGDCDTCPAGPC
jgi:hypothetical protein